MTYKELKHRNLYLLGTEKRCLDIQTFFCELTFTKEFFLPEYENGLAQHERETIAALMLEKKGKELLIISETAPDAPEPSNVERWVSTAVTQLADILAETGMAYGIDYLWLDDFLSVTQEIETFYCQKNKPERQICVYGSEELLCDLISQNPNLPIAHMTWSTDSAGAANILPPNCQTISFEELCQLDRNNIYVILAEPVNAATKNQFSEASFAFGKEFHFYNSRRAKRPTSYYLKKTMYDSPRYTIPCNYATKALSVKNHGHIMACCSSVTLAMGNCKYTSIEEILSGIQAQIISLSINNRTFSFCSNLCFMFREEAYRLKDEEEIKNNTRKNNALLTVSDFNIQLGYDRSCNLACPSCRDHRITQPEEPREIVEMIHEEVKRACTLHPKNIRIGNGELFFSPYYRDIIYNCYESKQIALITNGQLFTPENWERLSKRYQRVSLEVSIDATTKETYRKLRGGDLNRLWKNMEFAGQLRQEGKLAKLSISFVIQAENFREMVDFVNYGNGIHADFIHFMKLNSWGHIPEEQFIQMDVYDPRNIHHEEFLNILRDPIFQQNNVHVDNINNFLN